MNNTTGNNDVNNSNNSNNTAGNNDAGGPLVKDLSEAELIAGCQAVDTRVEELMAQYSDAIPGLCKMSGGLNGYFDGEDPEEAAALCEDAYAECMAVESNDDELCIALDEQSDCEVSFEQIIKCIETDFAHNSALWSPYAPMACEELTTEEMSDQIWEDYMDSWPEDNMDCVVVEEKCEVYFY